MVLVAVLAGASYGQNTEIREFNLAMVIGQRVVTDPERLAWFEGAGMPLPDAVVPGQLWALGFSLAHGLSPDAPRGLTKVTHTR